MRQEGDSSESDGKGRKQGGGGGRRRMMPLVWQRDKKLRKEERGRGREKTGLPGWQLKFGVF